MRALKAALTNTLPAPVHYANWSALLCNQASAAVDPGEEFPTRSPQCTLHPHRGLVASQDPVQFKGSGARKRPSATGGEAYGTPRNSSTCFHEVPTRTARDLPSSWPWGVMVTEGAGVP